MTLSPREARERPSSQARPKRVFWLGMHKVLKPTELRRLRGLGVEVFNPAYISPIFDQSADLTIDDDQPTTLPPEVFTRLLEHDFFYTQVPPDIAELLNAYFDAVIVTINPDWLKAMLAAYRGPVIYRLYGQPYCLSDHLISIGLWETLVTRGDFHIVPFAAESVEREHPWFLELCSHIVPYQISDDVFEHTGAWGAGRRRPEIATSIPNIQNPYYAAAYHVFVGQYPQRYFRIYGPQRTAPADPRIMGGMERTALLRRMSESAGYFYPYQDNVSYLPPIEMMQLGGPVVHTPGSLLARFFDGRSPGVALDPEDADRKLRRLLAGDKRFTAELLDAQEPVRRRYDRDVVGPIFDAAFTELFGAPTAEAPARKNGLLLSRASAEPAAERPTVAIPLHVDGLFNYMQGRPYAFEGIPRVMDVVVDTLVTHTDAHVLISCTAGSEAVVHDFFLPHLQAGRVSLYVLPPAADAVQADLNRLRFIEYLDSEALDVRAILAPHYYLFPECLLTRRPLVLYLPDYFPHLMPDEVFDASREKDAQNKRVGVAIAKRAERVLTNSEYTRRYLPDAGFVDPSEDDKIVVAPLPFLGVKRAMTPSPEERRALEKRIGGAPFLFYPTANRPNKKIAFLMRVFAHLRLSRPELKLVLTCDLNHYPEAREAAEHFQLGDHLMFMPGSTESAMRWLYENTAALCLTSINEGNFPPQVLEALNYGAPVVATRLPTITEVLGEEAHRMLLCRPTELADFADKLEIAMDRREAVLRDQAVIFERLKTWNSPELFARRLANAFPGVRFRLSGEQVSIETGALA